MADALRSSSAIDPDTGTVGGARDSSSGGRTVIVVERLDGRVQGDVQAEARRQGQVALDRLGQRDARDDVQARRAHGQVRADGGVAGAQFGLAACAVRLDIHQSASEREHTPGRFQHPRRVQVRLPPLVQLRERRQRVADKLGQPVGPQLPPHDAGAVRVVDVGALHDLVNQTSEEQHRERVAAVPVEVVESQEVE